MMTEELKRKIIEFALEQAQGVSFSARIQFPDDSVNGALALAFAASIIMRDVWCNNPKIALEKIELMKEFVANG